MATATTSGPASRGVTVRSGANRWGGKLVITIVVTVALLILGFLATQIFGIVSGTEFCPDTFERRGFAFLEIPFTGIQISSIDRRTDTGVVELHVIAQGYLVPDHTEPKTWHLLSLTRIRGTYAEGDAELLMKYFDAQNDKDEFAWLTWSEQNPNLAKVLWPAVAKAAQADRYLIVPDLFTHARSTKDPAELQKKVDATLATIRPASKPSTAKEAEKPDSKKSEAKKGASDKPAKEKDKKEK
jgi:hypothetical protein